MADINLGLLYPINLNDQEVLVKSFQSTSGLQLQNQLTDWSAEHAGGETDAIAVTIDLKGCNAGGVWHTQFVTAVEPGGLEFEYLRSWNWKVWEASDARSMDANINAWLAELVDAYPGAIVMTITNGAAGAGTKLLTVIAWADGGEPPPGGGFAAALRRPRTAIAREAEAREAEAREPE